MPLRIAINGYGRIGRNILRALYEGNHSKDLSIVAINDLGSLEVNTHLTKHDSTHGALTLPVKHANQSLHVGNDEITYLQESAIEKLPWKELGIDLALECSGRFTSKEAASQHLKSGAKRVLISAPGTDADATIVYGVNHQSLTKDHKIISNASCTTNCLAPLS